ncbi:hypothetical protein JCM21900_001765 [Sporobolomyces salmonicolor]
MLRTAPGRPCPCSLRGRPPRQLPRLSRPLSSSPPTSRATAVSTPPAAATTRLLADLRALLKRYPLLDQAWNSRLERALADFSRSRKARITVVGDQRHGTQGVVTALLDDPLASSPDVTVALEARRLSPDAPEAIVLKYGEESGATASEVTLPSAWLRDHQAEVAEIVHRDVVPLESSFSTLHLSDAVVLVLSSSQLLSSKPSQTLLYNLYTKPNLVIALNSLDADAQTVAPVVRALRHQLETLFPAESDLPQTIAISTTQALEALAALNPSEPDQPPSYDAFQRGYVTSQIPVLKEQLSESTSSHSSSPVIPTALQQQTATYVLSAALARAAFAGASISDALISASASLAALSQMASEESLALLASLGVDPATGLLRVPRDELQSALQALDELLLSRLAWWKLPSRVDDLHAEISLVVSQTYLPRFEDALVFSTGRAIALSQSLSSRTDTLLSTHPAFSALPPSTPAQALANLYSPTMLNRLEQAALEATSTISSTALSASLSARRAQLSAPGGPVDALQRRAQAAVLQSATLSLGSIATGVGMHLAEYAELATNFGVGLLGTTVAAWVLQGRWERAKKRFRADVEERVTGSVEEDLGLAARRLVDRSTYKARLAVSLGEELVRQRRDDFEAFRAELVALEKARREGSVVGASEGGGV